MSQQCWSVRANHPGYSNTNRVLKAAYVPTTRSYYINQGRWKPRGSYEPKAGDIILFKFSSDPSDSYIGIVTGINKNNEKIQTTEGNTYKYGVVAHHEYYKTDSTIWGYGIGN